MRAFLTIFLLSSIAGAAPAPLAVEANRVTLPSGISITVGKRESHVVRGTQRVALEYGAVKIESATFDATTGVLAIKWKREVERMANSEADGPLELDVLTDSFVEKELIERLDLDEGTKALKQKRYADAEAAFTRLAASRKDAESAVFVAGTQALAHKDDASIATLREWLTPDHALATYVALVRQKPFAALLERSDVLALQTPGTTKIVLDPKTDGDDDENRHHHFKDGELAYTARYKTFATLNSVGESNSRDNVCFYSEGGSELGCVDVKHGAQRVLSNFGFGAPVDIEHGRATQKRFLTFARAKLGIVWAQGTVRVLRGDQELVRKKLVDTDDEKDPDSAYHYAFVGVDWAAHLPNAKKLIMRWTEREPTGGCALSGGYHSHILFVDVP